MRRVPSFIAVSSLLLLHATAAHSANFGRASNTTVLGQPLDFSVVLNAGDEPILPECVSAEVVSGDNKIPPPLVKVRLDNGPDGPNSLVRVVTDVRIDEPVVAVTVVIGCSTRTARRFVAFVDPPGIAQAQSSAETVPAVVNPSRNDPPPVLSTAPRPAYTARAETPSRQPTRRIRRPSRAGNTVVARAPTAAAAAAAAAADSVASRKGQTGKVLRAEREAAGPRLKLDAPVRMTAAEAAASAAAAAAQQAAASEAASSLAKVEEDLRAQERERLKTLEESITRLRTESLAMQKNVAELQAQLRQAQTDRYANPLVYALAGLCALLAAAVGALLWRQSRMQRDSAWWNESAAASLPRTDELNASSASGSAAVGGKDAIGAVTPQAERSVWPSAMPAVGAVAAVASASSVAAHAAGAEPAPYATSVGAALMEEPRREVTVEELMDLEQQADFFLVLGQEEAAIELLTSHLRSTGGSSPLPFLKLMEIHDKRGERDLYMRLRDRFNQRFNAKAPDWGHDPQGGLSLEHYPGVVERLQAVWAREPEAMALLESLLFRRDSYTETFELPAYVELLMLYGMARDLLDQSNGPGEVDLLLPIGGGELDAPQDHSGNQLGLHAPFSFELPSPPDVPLDLDIGNLPVITPPPTSGKGGGNVR